MSELIANFSDWGKFLYNDSFSYLKYHVNMVKNNNNFRNRHRNTVQVISNASGYLVRI